mgnify:FL=1
MYNLKFVNIHQYSHQWTWLHALPPKIKTLSIILWFILSLYCPLVIFWFVLFSLILLNSYLQSSVKTFSLHQIPILLVCLSNFFLYLSLPFIFSHITYQYSLSSQIMQIKINYKHLQHSSPINETYPHCSTSTNTLYTVPIFFLLFKQYILLISFLYFCRLIEITTNEEELTIAYLSLLVFSKDNNTNRLLFCFSVTKQYECLIIDKITNILCSIKFRNIDFYRPNFIYYFIHLTVFYLEIFINKLLVYSQMISECLYSRELTLTQNLEST